MACCLHSQHGLVSEVPYRPVQTIVRSLSSLFKLVPCVAESSAPPSPLLFFSTPLLVSWSSSGISDYITNRWGGAHCQGHWVCEGSWLMLPTESIPCQFERDPALVLLELSSTPAGAQILPVPFRWITETLFSGLSIHHTAPHQGLSSLWWIYQRSLYSNLSSNRINVSRHV